MERALDLQLETRLLVSAPPLVWLRIITAPRSLTSAMGFGVPASQAVLRVEEALPGA